MTSNKLENLLHLIGWFSWQPIQYECFCVVTLVYSEIHCESAIEPNSKVMSNACYLYWSFLMVCLWDSSGP